MPTQSPFVVVVWGDSIAAAGWPASAEFTCNVAMNTGMPLLVINESVGGKSAAQAVEEFRAHVLSHNPHLVIIHFGLNDLRHDGSRGMQPISTPEEFAVHLTEMVQCCREEAKAQVLLLGYHKCRRPMILPTGLTYDESRERYNATIREVAKALCVPYLDMERALATIPDSNWVDFVSEDGIHLSPLGLEMYASIVGTAISQLARGETPVHTEAAAR